MMKKIKQKKIQRMDPSHPKWREFLDRLEGAEGCDFKQKDPNDPTSVTWKCAGGTDKSLAGKILAKMGLSDVEILSSFTYFEKEGGYCDCEILFNVAVGEEVEA